jgi:hypothetical protein
LQGARETANIQAGFGVIWRIPVYIASGIISVRTVTGVGNGGGFRKRGKLHTIKSRRARLALP